MEIQVDGRKVEEGEFRYDYKNQCWVKYLGDGCWEVQECGHAKVLGKPVSDLCFACQRAGVVMQSHDQIH